METINLLYKRQYPITDSISIYIPTVGEILEKEDEYYGLVTSLTSMPVDMMVQLDDAGLDFATVSDYELFLLVFTGIKTRDTSLIFGDLDLSKFEMNINQESGYITLEDKENDIIIDRFIYEQIATVLRKIHHLKKNNRKPANKDAKDFMLKRAREKMKRNKNRREMSQLELLIISMVNSEQYKYNFEETLDLTIYQFNESVRQVIKKIDYDNRMHGVYAGTIDAKQLSEDDLNWLCNNKQ